MTRQTSADYARRYRDKQRGGPARTPAEHGTRAAAARHRRAGEKPKDVCPPCHEAEKAYMRQKQAERRKG